MDTTPPTNTTLDLDSPVQTNARRIWMKSVKALLGRTVKSIRFKRTVEIASPLILCLDNERGLYCFPAGPGCGIHAQSVRVGPRT